MTSRKKVNTRPRTACTRCGLVVAATCMQHHLQSRKCATAWLVRDGVVSRVEMSRLENAPAQREIDWVGAIVYSVPPSLSQQFLRRAATDSEFRDAVLMAYVAEKGREAVGLMLEGKAERAARVRREVSERAEREVRRELDWVKREHTKLAKRIAVLTKKTTYYDRKKRKQGGNDEQTVVGDVAGVVDVSVCGHKFGADLPESCRPRTFPRDRGPAWPGRAPRTKG